MTDDPNARLNAAYLALREGRTDAARQDVRAVIAAYPTVGPAHHLLALIERRAGQAEAAERAFRAALDLMPDDPEPLNNYGNFLDEAGRGEAALPHYRRAIALRPDFGDAHLNLGIVAQRLGRLDEAEAALGRAVELLPRQAKAWTALGLLHLALDRTDAAEASFDRALAIAPASPRPLLAKAQLALDHGDPSSALTLYRRVRAAGADDPQTRFGEAAAQQQLGEHHAAIDLIETIVAADPTNVDAHGRLSRLRWQLGDADGFAASYQAALAARPGEAGLWASLLNTLGSAGRHEAVLETAAAARQAAGPNPEFDLLEADAASELGDATRADRLFAALAAYDDPNVALRHARHLLRQRRPDEAARAVLPVAESHRHRLAWAYLATAWRLTGDPRWEWLEGDPRFVGEIDIGTIGDALPALADELRALHLTRTHPFDQTLRGGTQTNGSLLTRRDPPIVQLRAALEAAVRAFIDQLPPPDPRHPLLREPRDGFRFAGSWSVRLQSQGFHVNHVHPAGWISSAFYVALPPRPAGSTDGWLALGEPPAELRLDLAPFRLIEPKPGRLALFPSYMWHGTRPFEAGERLTVAFDVAPRRAA